MAFTWTSTSREEIRVGNPLFDHVAARHPDVELVDDEVGQDPATTMLPLLGPSPVDGDAMPPEDEHAHGGDE